MIIGYTTGVYDLFHIGHLNLLKNAKGMCDKRMLDMGCFFTENASVRSVEGLIKKSE